MSTFSGPSQRGRPASALVGRDSELDLLASALDDAVGARARTFLIAGDAGMGKTRLCDDFSRVAREQGFVVAWGQGWEVGDAPAYWPWIQLLRNLTSQIEPDVLLGAVGSAGRELVQLVPELADHIGAQVPVSNGHPTERFALFDEVAVFLTHLSERAPLLLVLDDLHAADESSLLLLHFVARSAGTARLVSIGTYSESDARTNRAVHRLLSGLAREAETVVLKGLDREAVGTLYEAAVGERAPDVIRDALYRASEGNPFFVEETMRLLFAKGELHRPDFSAGFRVPEGIREVVIRRLSPLSPEAKAALAVASVIGPSFKISLLHEVSGIDMDRLWELLAEGISLGLLEETSSAGDLAFSHILVRETLYEDLPIVGRMKTHRSVGEALERMHAAEPESQLAELAHHWFKAAQAGDHRKALEYSVRAAKAAETALAHEDAIQLYHRALRMAEQAGTEREERAQLQAQLEAAKDAAARPARTDVASAGSDEMIFVREGDYWTLSFEGQTARLRDSKGMRHIARLLQSPGHEFHAVDLASPPAPGGDNARRKAAREGLNPGLGDAGEILDATAKAQYRQRLADLAEELDEAAAFNDPERAAAAQAEIDALSEQLAAAVGLRGRDRKAGSPTERARVNVTKTIKDALRRIHDAHPPLWRHLVATVRTGTYCSYNPDPRVRLDWRVS